MAVEIACPAWRVLCSAAWNRRPSVVVGKPARPPYCTCRQQIVAGGRAKLLECPLDRRVHFGGHVGERRRRIDEVTFGTHCHLLRVRQGLATSIGEEPVERAAEVPHVEPDRSCSAGTRATSGISSGSKPATGPRSQGSGLVGVVIGLRCDPNMNILLHCDMALLHESVTGLHDANRRDPHLPMRYDTGRPSLVIRLRISEPRTTSLLCPAGLRARADHRR